MLGIGRNPKAENFIFHLCIDSFGIGLLTVSLFFKEKNKGCRRNPLRQPPENKDEIYLTLDFIF